MPPCWVSSYTYTWHSARVTVGLLQSITLCLFVSSVCILSACFVSLPVHLSSFSQYWWLQLCHSYIMQRHPHFLTCWGPTWVVVGCLLSQINNRIVCACVWYVWYVCRLWSTERVTVSSLLVGSIRCLLGELQLWPQSTPVQGLEILHVNNNWWTALHSWAIMTEIKPRRIKISRHRLHVNAGSALCIKISIVLQSTVVMGLKELFLLVVVVKLGFNWLRLSK